MIQSFETVRSIVRAQTKKLIADNQVNVAEGSELIYDAVLAAANLREKIVNLEAHLKDLENQQKNLILKAEKAGTVYSINNRPVG